MDQKDIVIAEKIIKMFRTAVNTYKIYPASSPIIANTINSFLTAISEYLGTHNSLILYKSHNTIFVEGQNLKSSNELIPILEQFSIDSVSFNKGLTAEELNSFIGIIGARKDSSRVDINNFEESVKNNNIKNIVLNEIKYVAVKEGEQIVKAISGLVDNLQGDTVSLITSLREIYNEMDVVEDSKTKKEITDTLVKKLASLDPVQLKDFFDQELPQKIEQSGLKDAVVSTLPEEKIRVIFNDISIWYEDIKKNSSSDFEAVERLGDLSRFLGKILSSPQAKNIPFRFYEELLRVGVLEEIPSWIKKEEPSLVFKVDELLEKSSTALLDPMVRDGIPDLVRQLCQAELVDIADKLTSKVMENLRQTSLKARNDTIKTLIQIYDVFVVFHKEINIKKLEQVFTSSIEKEKDLGIYKDLLDVLKMHVVRLLLSNRYEESMNIIMLFKRHMYPATDPDKERRDVTNESFVKLSGEISDILISEIKSGVEERQRQAFKIVAVMEDTMTGALSKAIKESDDYKTRKLCAIVLKNIGEKAVRFFIESLDLTVSTDSMRKIVTILDEFTGIDIFDSLRNLLEYPDPQAKRSIIRYMQKLDKPELRNLLIDKLGDKDIMIDVIKILADIKATEATEDLMKLINARDSSIQEEACIALGKLGDPRAIPVLLGLLKGRKSFFGIGGATVQDTVKIRAAWALGNFRDKELIQKLQEFLKLKDEPVKAEISRSIKKIREQA